MRNHLGLFLFAPMAAFGTNAGYQRRGTELFPTRSAVLGLVGAALGVAREDPKNQRRLRALRVAVQMRAEPSVLHDFHTTQTVPRGKEGPRDTRRDALRAANAHIHTTITHRDYLCDMAAAVAIWHGEESGWSLKEIAAAIKRPRYLSYAGRKSCTLAPMPSEIIEAETPPDAVRSVPTPEWVRLPNMTPGPVMCDPFPGGRPSRVDVGPVEPVDRVRWHFDQGEIWRFDQGGPDV